MRACHFVWFGKFDKGCRVWTKSASATIDLDLWTFQMNLATGLYRGKVVGNLTGAHESLYTEYARTREEFHPRYRNSRS